jgi:hypothetical protein
LCREGGLAVALRNAVLLISLGRSEFRLSQEFLGVANEILAKVDADFTFGVIRATSALGSLSTSIWRELAKLGLVSSKMLVYR